MEDRYLFKAKRIDNEEWVEGNIITCNDRYFIVPKFGISCIEQHKNLMGDNTISLYAFEVDPSTICRCTGSKDKNGKLIWENDIANCFEAECCGKISWNESEAGFYFDVLLEDGTYEEEHIYDYADCMDVIGNIFDNKELLESEEK